MTLRSGDGMTLTVRAPSGSTGLAGDTRDDYARIYNADRVLLAEAPLRDGLATLSISVPAGSRLWAVGDGCRHGLWAERLSA